MTRTLNTFVKVLLVSFVLTSFNNAFAEVNCELIVIEEKGYNSHPVAIYKNGSFEKLGSNTRWSNITYALNLKEREVYTAKIHIYPEQYSGIDELEVETFSKAKREGKCFRDLYLNELNKEDYGNYENFLKWLASDSKIIKFDLNDELELAHNFSILHVTDLNKDNYLEFWVSYTGLYGRKVYSLLEEEDTVDPVYVEKSFYCPFCD